MIERMMLRASDTVASGGDPFAAVKPDLIVGPIVRAVSPHQRYYTEHHRQFIPLSTSVDWPRTQHMALWDAAHAGGHLLPFQPSVRAPSFYSLQ